MKQCSELGKLWERQIGNIHPRAFSLNIGGCKDLIQRLERYAELSGHDGCVNTVHFNPSGDILVSGSDDKEIVFWDWAARSKKLSFNSGHDNNVFQARIMPFSNDRSVVTCAADGQVRHAVIPENGCVSTKKLAQHRGRAHKLAIEPGSPRTFFSCGEDGDVRQFDLREGSNMKIVTCKGRPVIYLNAIVINPRNPNYFAVGGSDEFARVYDIRKVSSSGEVDSPVDVFAPKHLIGTKQHVHITCVAYSQQEELLISYNDELIYLFDKGGGLGPSPPSPSASSSTKEEAAAATRFPNKAEGGGKATNEAEEGKRNVSKEENKEEGNREGKARDKGDQNEENEKKEYEVYKGHRNAQTVKGVNFFGPNCEYVVSGSDCGNIFIWKKRGAELVAMMEGDRQVVNCLEPHPSVTVLATSGMDDSVKIWAPTAPAIQPLPKNAHKVMEKNKLSREDKHSIPDFLMLSLIHAAHMGDFDRFRRVRRRR
ncbi:DDB1- and CUL4-associated factor 8 [Selaginella moellendorffii]|uniref:DDB1- and CUL4-associated factor 8 n=1 Tax=Selaginella moellendorffii TaxID=88036 RepID=UPI000D1CE72B|nr:DDB1- and CUL4-associated factor 8 [Selaginella moellendorffii]|eukprot:XP_024524743.1 DDB1- and CUL4-associated factor 8 [Selaginella moellendorffii]